MIRPNPFRDAIRQSRLTLTELADLADVSLNTLRSLNSGRNLNPKRTTRRKLAAALRQHSATLASLADSLDPE